jgi:hypothetical protein
MSQRQAERRVRSHTHNCLRRFPHPYFRRAMTFANASAQQQFLNRVRAQKALGKTRDRRMIGRNIAIIVSQSTRALLVLLRRQIAEDGLPPPAPVLRIHARSRRAAVAVRAADSSRRKPERTRTRRSVVDITVLVWRRCVPGPNRISRIGIWKTGARRASRLVNRLGDTGWRRTRREMSGQRLSFRGTP